MPTKARLAKEKEKKIAEEKLRSFLEKLTPCARAYLEKSTLTSTLIKLNNRYPDGLFEVDKSCNEIVLAEKHADGVKERNKIRKNDSDTDAQEIRERHITTWGKRGCVKKIAELEGLSDTTIRRYIKKFPP
jgi:hypothetical protein